MAALTNGPALQYHLRAFFAGEPVWAPPLETWEAFQVRLARWRSEPLMPWRSR